MARLIPRSDLIPAREWAIYSQCRTFIATGVPPVEPHFWQVALGEEARTDAVAQDRQTQRQAGCTLLALLEGGHVAAQGQSYDQVSQRMIPLHPYHCGGLSTGTDAEMLKRPVEDIPAGFWRHYREAETSFSFDNDFYYAAEDLEEPHWTLDKKYQFVECQVRGFFGVLMHVSDIARACVSLDDFRFQVQDRPSDSAGNAQNRASRPAQKAPAKNRKGRGRPDDKRRSVLEAMSALYSSETTQGLTHESLLCEVNEWLTASGRVRVSLNTIRRARKEFENGQESLRPA